MKPTVYIETTIPSYLAAWPSRDLIRAAHQQLTREWWAERDEFDLYTSEFVVQECEQGDVQAAAERLVLLSGIPILEQVPTVTPLVEALINEVPIPKKAALDAFHVAMAATNGIQYLLTWNCTHLANAALRNRIEAICRTAGFEPPLICTPQELRMKGA